MQKRTKSFVGTRPVFTGAPSLEIGGYTLDKTNQTFNEGDIIPAGSQVVPNEDTKKVLVVKSAKVKSIDAENNAKVTLYSDDFVTPIFAVGDHVAKAEGGAISSTPTIVSIEDGDNGYIVTLSSAITGLAANDIIEEVASEDCDVVVAGIITADNSNKIYLVQPGLYIKAGDKLYKGSVGSSALLADAKEVVSYDPVSGKLVTGEAISSGAAGDNLTKVYADATTATKAVTTTKVAKFRKGTALSASAVEVTKDEVSVGVCKDTMQYACYERRILPVRPELKNGDLLAANVHIRFTQSK